MQVKHKIRHARESHRNNLFVAGALQFAAVSFLGSPLFFQMSKSLKGTYFLLGVLTSAAQILHSEHSKKMSAIKNVFDKYELQGLSNEISASRKIDEAIDHIRAQEDLVGIIETLPEYKRDRYTAEYRLQGLLEPIRLPAQIATNESTNLQVKKALPVFNKALVEILDIDWMNHDFFYKSAVVTGDEGSGKSQMLAYMAANVIHICPDVDIRIHTIHYDPDEPWFPGLSPEVEQSLFITNPQECYNDMMNVYAELRRREVEKDKTSPPIVRYTDEFQGLASLLSKDAWAEYIDAMIQIKNRGRKYAKKVANKDTGIRIIAGTHSLKQKLTGLDSGFFAGSNVLCLGDSIKDPNTPFPADFDLKRLTAELNSAKAQLIGMGLMKEGQPHLDKARPAIVRLGNGSPQIKIIPKPELSSITYECIGSDIEHETGNTQTANATDYAGDDYMQKLAAWYRVNKNASLEDIQQQLMLLTDKVVSVELIQQLKDALDDE